MKHFLAQIALAIAIVIALFQSSCGGSMSGPDTTIEDNSKEKQLALRRLYVRREGVQEDKEYVYSVRCIKSWMGNVGNEDAVNAAMDQLKGFCPKGDVSSSSTKEQIQRVDIYSCALITFSKGQKPCQ